MIIESQCIDCKHFKNDGRFTCRAFPYGISDPLLLNEDDHREPYAGDDGIRFEPRERGVE